MATPLLLMSATDDRTPAAQPAPTRATHHRTDPNPPKPARGRKSKTQNGQQKKQPQRGMGVAQLERLLRQQQQQHHQNHYDHIQTHQTYPSSSNLHGINQPGFAHYGYPLYPASRCEMRPPIRVLDGPSELPSMPNMDLDGSCGLQLDHSYKKKRVIGEEAVGLMREKGKYDIGDQINVLPSNGYNFPGFDHHHHATSGGFSGFSYVAANNEAVAIHKKGNGTGNLMTEYGFFRGVLAGENEGWKFTDSNANCRENNKNDNYLEVADLNLKMGCSDSSSPSPSSSSLSSLTTATTTHSASARITGKTAAAAANTSCCDLDLSLKLSY